MSGETAPHEAGFSKDADKLIRRLSLVAFLLTHNGKPVRAEDIRVQVEGYSLMTDEAFKRRFYEDRAELAALGIETQSARAAGGELYSLPAANYYLPAIALSREELVSLGACLLVLEDRFAYSKPLRLALLSLAQGRPEVLGPEAAPPLAVLPQKESLKAAARLPKLQAAIADRKTVVFEYYAIHRDEQRERTVDPYGLLMIGDEWYLLGHCHLRCAVRTFRLSRIRSRVRYATKAPHDFAPPSGFALAEYRDRPPWQLDGRLNTARVRVSEDMAWWVEAHFGHCGTFEPQPDGGVVYETGFGSSRALLSWALGLGEAAEIIAPAGLRDAAAAQLATLSDRLARPPASVPAHAFAPRGPSVAQTGPTAADWHVDVDRFTRLTALASYLLGRCSGGDTISLPVHDVCAALALRPTELKADLRLLNLVNFGGDGALLFAEIKGDHLEVLCDLAGPALATPARLSPLQADTLLLAVELVGGQLPYGSAAALHAAADKVRRARHAAPPLVQAEETLNPQDEILSAVNAAIRERRLMAIDYWSEGSNRTSQRVVEPYLLVRSKGEWYYVCYCRASEATRVFRVATTKRAEVLHETFVPRTSVELDLYRKEGIPATAQYAPTTAALWYSVTVRRYVDERQAVDGLPDGACLARQAYLDLPWLVHHILRFGGEAVPLEPPEAVRAVTATVERLAARYGRVADP